MKKEYLRPDAEYISFYSVEDIADVGGNAGIGGGISKVEGDDSWID